MILELLLSWMGLVSLLPVMGRIVRTGRIATGNPYRSPFSPAKRPTKRRRGRSPSSGSDSGGASDSGSDSPDNDSPSGSGSGSDSGSDPTAASHEHTEDQSEEDSRGQGAQRRRFVDVVTGADEAEEARLLSGLARTSEEGQSDRQSAEVEKLRAENLELKARLESTGQYADRLENTLGMRVGCDPNACANSEARLAVGTLKVMLPKETAMHNARIVPKPKPFDGVDGRGAVSFRNWFSDVQRFVFAVTWSEELLVPTAAAFLIGDALRWWEKQSALLARMGKVISSWAVFADALFERWAQQNEEAAARTKLHYLRQDRKPIQDHLRRFEALYALIPFEDPTSVDNERDKIHRFFLSCNAEWQAKIATSPAGSKWESFQAVSTFIITHISDNPVAPPPADRIVQEARNAHVRSDQINPSAPADDRPRSGSRGRRGRRSSDGQGQPPRGSDAGAGPSRPRFQALKEYTNGAGVRFLRNRAVANYCMKNRYCICCYRYECQVRTCTQAPAAGVPEGYVPPPPSMRQGPPAAR